MMDIGIEVQQGNSADDGGGSDYVSFAVDSSSSRTTMGDTSSLPTTATSNVSGTTTTTNRRAAGSAAATTTTTTGDKDDDDAFLCKEELFEDEYRSSSPPPLWSSSSFSFWPPCWNRKGTTTATLFSCWNNDCALSRLFCCLFIPLNMSSNSNSSSIPIPPSSSRPSSHKTTTNSSSNKNNIDWKSVSLQIKLFFQMACPYYKESRTGRCLLCILLILTLMNACISALFSFLNKDFWNALSDRNIDDFQTVLYKYIVALLFGAPFIALYKFQQEQLAVHWREWMTCRTLQLYTQNRIYYKLERGGSCNNTSSDNSSDTENHHHTKMVIDNPDQRISQDIESFTSFSLSLLVTILISFLDLVVFSIILWMIYPSLFIAIFLYAIIGTIITTVLGHVLIQLQFQQLQNEANLRYALVRWRDNAESIAFYNGEALEGQTVQQRVDFVMMNRRAINVAVRNLEFFTNSYQFLVQILPIMVVSKQYFAGEIALGVISQSVGAFAHILSDMSIIVTQFEQLSAFCAGIERLSTFFQAMRHARSHKNATATGDDSDDDDSCDTCSLLHVPSDSSCLDNKHHGRNGSAPTTTSHKTNNAAPPPLPDYGSIEVTLKTNDNMAPIMQSLSSSMTEPVATTPSTTAASLDTEYVPMGDHTYNQTGASTGAKGTYGTIVLQAHDTMGGNNNNYHQETMPSVSVGADTVNNSNNNNTTILSIHRLDLCTPDRKRLLIENLTLQIQTGEHLLIVGNSGAGKSSLLRAIAGLWSAGNGQIKRPQDDQVYFLPQRPYCTVGSLKDQLLYPSCCHDDNDDSPHKTTTTATAGRRHDTDYLLSILQQVDLWSVASRLGNGDPVAGLDISLDWTNVLSLGEQQRLAFGRLLVNRPRLAILDESTSALDMASEARMYALLQQTATATTSTSQHEGGGGLTYISVGHRPSLVQYHDKRLRLMGQDGYELSDIVPGMTS